MSIVTARTILTTKLNIEAVSVKFFHIFYNNKYVYIYNLYIHIYIYIYVYI